VIARAAVFVYKGKNPTPGVQRALVDHRHHALSRAVIEQVYAILGDPHRCADGAGGLELDNTSIDRRRLLSSRAAQRRDGSAYRRRGLK
jgi:hypothetical protein